ncbi:hypothetical protein Tco_0445355 [Tanacetum coccineum]
MLKIEVYEMGGQEEIFTSESWRRAFDINEPIYTKLCHEFYSTYEFDEVVTDKELIMKKLNKFRLGGRGHSLTLLEFAHRYDKIQRNELWLMSMFEARNQNRMARKMILLTDEVLDGLSALIYCRSLDATTLRELIGSNGRLITEDPALGVPRVAMPTPPSPTMQDLYDRMGRMEIRQATLERMYRTQSYHSNRYAFIFEYMAGQYNIPLQGAYAPPGYDEEP